MGMATKITGNLIAVIALLIIAAGVFVYLNFGDLAKRAAEHIATNALGVDVDIASLDISLENKTATVSGIEIANPPGYKGSHAITAETINIGLNTASKQLIDFDDIDVNGVVVNLEVTPQGSNLTDLKALAQKEEQRESVGSEQIRVIVRKMVIGTSTLNPRITLLKDDDLGSIKIPAINLSGIGARENGVLAREAIVQVVTKYIGVAQREANQAGLMKGLPTEDLKAKAQEQVDELKDEIKGIFNRD